MERINNENFCIDIPDCHPEDIIIKTFGCHIGDEGSCQKSKNQEWDYEPIEKKIQTRMEIEGISKCLTIEKIGFKTNIKTHFCNESVTLEYNETEHTLKTGDKCLASTVEVVEVWAGNLSDGSYAVLLLNRASFSAKVEISWKELGLVNKSAKLRDLREKKDLGECMRFKIML